jgi:hypothetical protein
VWPGVAPVDWADRHFVLTQRLLKKDPNHNFLSRPELQIIMVSFIFFKFRFEKYLDIDFATNR